MQQFREAYLQANGTLVGADTEWSKYRDANPILNKDGTQRKAQHWSDWYSSQMNRALERRTALRGAPPSVRKGSTPSRTGRGVYDASEERRVGKACGRPWSARGAPRQKKKK